MQTWPKFALPSLTYHETIPGHAWQGAYLTETGKLPLVRILISGFNAYVEGYALYAEQLGDEIGMYDNDWAGRLATCRPNASARCASWSTPACTPSAGPRAGRPVGRGQLRAHPPGDDQRDRPVLWHSRPSLRLQGWPHRDQPPARPRQGPTWRQVRPAHVRRPAVKTGAVPLTVLGAQVDDYIKAGGRVNL